MPTERMFRLVFTPTASDWTRGVLARQDIEGATRKRIWLGVLIASLGLVGFGLSRLSEPDPPTFMSLAIPAVFVLFGVLHATGVFVRISIAQWFRANPELMLPSDNTLYDAEYIATSQGIEHRVAWSTFNSAIVLSDVLVLTLGEGPAGGLAVLPKRGLQDPATWADLLAFVTSRVQGAPVESRR